MIAVTGSGERKAADHEARSERGLDDPLIVQHPEQRRATRTQNEIRAYRAEREPKHACAAHPPGSRFHQSEQRQVTRCSARTDAGCEPGQQCDRHGMHGRYWEATAVKPLDEEY